MLFYFYKIFYSFLYFYFFTFIYLLVVCLCNVWVGISDMAWGGHRTNFWSGSFLQLLHGCDLSNIISHLTIHSVKRHLKCLVFNKPLILCQFSLPLLFHSGLLSSSIFQNLTMTKVSWQVSALFASSPNTVTAFY